MNTTVETPLEYRVFTEQTPTHTRTVFRVDNPLQHKTNETHLLDVAAISQKERYEWMDAEMKKLLPGQFYKLVVDSWKEKDKRKAADMFARAEQWMRNNRIQIVHPGGRSLSTFVYVKGQVVAEFELRLETK